MPTARFDMDQIVTVRSAVMALVHSDDDAPDGWAVGDVDPTALLDIFSALRLRPGYTLIAYRYRDSGNGNGVVWAVPTGTDPTSATIPPDAHATLADPPRPDGALDDVMDAIEGDGSDWSYLSASLFARETDEFGALWHGVSWYAQSILGAHPEQRGAHRLGEIGIVGNGPWRWSRPLPADWRPAVDRHAGATAVSFLTYDPVGQETIRLNTDRFASPPAMRFSRRTQLIGQRSAGIVF